MPTNELLRTLRSAAALSTLLGPLACGGAGAPPPASARSPAAPSDPSPPEPARPESAPATSQAAIEPETAPATVPEPPTESAAADRAPETPSGPSRPAREILLESDTDFLLDYPASDLKQAAQSKCSGASEAAMSPQVTAECLQKERDAFAADVLTFREAPGGGVTWTIYRRQASRLQEVYSGSIDLKDAGDGAIVMTTKGRSKGQLPFFRGQREIKVRVPDDYTLVLSEPALGELVYRAKYGLVQH